MPLSTGSLDRYSLYPMKPELTEYGDYCRCGRHSVGSPDTAGLAWRIHEVHNVANRLFIVGLFVEGKENAE